MGERVHSKHLFDYQLEGQIAEDVAAFENQLEEDFVTGLGKAMLSKMIGLAEQRGEESDREFAVSHFFVKTPDLLRNLKRLKQAHRAWVA